MEHNTQTELIFSPEDSHANHSALRVKEKAKKILATSGRKCLELLKRLDRPGLLARTLLESLDWHSSKYFLIWKVRGITPKHLSFQLALSGRCTNETDFGLWLTPTASDGKMSKKKTENLYVTENGTIRLRNKAGSSSNAGLANQVQFYPTPRASDGNSPGIHGNAGQDLRTVVAMMEGLYPTPTVHGNYNKKGASKNSGNGLATFVKLFPTPTAQDAKNSTLPPSQKGRDSIPGMLLTEGVTGKLNPQWVEWLMGYPIGWTELEDSETPSCPK